MEGRLVRPAAGTEQTLCPGLTVRVLGPSLRRLEELEARCRELYEETDPAAFLTRLDRLDAAMNNFSIMLLLEYRGVRILLPGDTNCMGYGELMAEDLRADLFKVGHHGQRTACPRAAPGHPPPGGGVLRLQRPALRQRRARRAADDRRQRRGAVFFRLSAGARRRGAAAPPGADVHRGRPAAPCGGPMSPVPMNLRIFLRGQVYPSPPALHFLPAAERKKGGEPRRSAVRQCGDLPQGAPGDRPCEAVRAEAAPPGPRDMAEVRLVDIKKVYPHQEPKKKKKGAEEKKTNLQITDEGVLAVQAFSLDIADKEFIVLVGPSGCGKSTTLRMIAGLEEISGGELYIDGKLMNDVAPKDRDIAMVFQNYALYPHMTVRENMAFR